MAEWQRSLLAVPLTVAAHDRGLESLQQAFSDLEQSQDREFGELFKAGAYLMLAHARRGDYGQAAALLDQIDRSVPPPAGQSDQAKIKTIKEQLAELRGAFSQQAQSCSGLIWPGSARAGDELRLVSQLGAGGYQSKRLSGDGRWILEDGGSHLLLRESASGAVVGRLQHGGWGSSALTLTPSGQLAVLVRNDGCMALLDFRHERILATRSPLFGATGTTKIKMLDHGHHMVTLVSTVSGYALETWEIARSGWTRQSFMEDPVTLVHIPLHRDR